MLDSVKTKFFQNCLGVFQGGGCRGSAYVGAFEEAYKRGVGFSELVGTSAGSIIAVMIAAGASPAKLREIVLRLNFKEFLRKPKDIPEYYPPKGVSLLKWVPVEFIRSNSKVFSHLGNYNSSYIKEWVESELRDLLKIDKEPVKFKDLRIPTTVIVTDLVRRKVRLYSSTNSPDEEVASAVQASCNIPFFFQPVENRFVDGGLLSNLPSFIFQKEYNKIYSKILAFSLESKTGENKFYDFFSFNKALIDTTLDGNLDIQLDMQKDLHIIRINTGDIKATDFDKITPDSINYLMQQGRESTKYFFENELSIIKNEAKRDDICPDLFCNYNSIVTANTFNHEEVIILEQNTDWVYDLFPTLLLWATSGAKINVLIKRNTDNVEHGPFRKRFLKYMGANCSEVDDIPFVGYIFNGSHKEKCKAIILNKSNSISSSFYSKKYYGEEDYDVICALRGQIPEFSEVKSQKKFKPIVSRLEDNKEIFKLLKDVKQYNSSKVKISIKEVEVEKVLFITRYVRGYKYRQISILFEMFNSEGIDLFQPAKLKLIDKKYTIFVPPVIEKIGSNYFVIEGNTRFLYAYRNGISKIDCVVVEGVEDSLPSTSRYEVRDLLLTDKNKIGDERYDNFDYEKFRKIEKAVRNPSICLK